MFIILDAFFLPGLYFGPPPAPASHAPKTQKEYVTSENYDGSRNRYQSEYESRGDNYAPLPPRYSSYRQNSDDLDDGYHSQQYYHRENTYPRGYTRTEQPQNFVEYRINLHNNRTSNAGLSCNFPSAPRDTSVFILKCVFPQESESGDCSSRGDSIPSETTAITSCKAPTYYSDTGDVILEVCRDGKWHNIGKSLTCKSLVTDASGASRVFHEVAAPDTSFRRRPVVEDVVHQSYFSSPNKCPPLRNVPGISIECQSKSPAGSSSYLVSVTDCKDHQIPGTEATYKCRTYYSGQGTYQRRCRENGYWSGSSDGVKCELECGRSNPLAGRFPLITFGEMTILGEWPWHAAIFIRDKHGDIMSNACGGTLISERAVVTAAHCVNLYLTSLVRDLDDLRVDLGRYWRQKDDPYVQKLSVEKIVNHPGYNPLNFESDIAIVILRDAVKIGFHVRPICYPGNNSPEVRLADGSYATVVGWGVDETRESSEELKAAKLKVMGYQECLESFGDVDASVFLAKTTTFCAGNKNGWFCQ